MGTYSSSPSYYNTFDQGGNVWEMNETIIADTRRGLRGGYFGNSELGSQELASTYRTSLDPTSESNTVGFRVSSLQPIPEPSSYALFLGSLTLGLVALRRR